MDTNAYIHDKHNTYMGEQGSRFNKQIIYKKTVTPEKSKEKDSKGHNHVQSGDIRLVGWILKRKKKEFDS